jgi:hypothetical protein
VHKTCPVFKQANETEPEAEVWGYQTVVIRLETIIRKAVQAANLERSAVDIAVFDLTADGITDLVATNKTLLYKDDAKPLAGVLKPVDIAYFDVVTLYKSHGRTYQMCYLFSDTFYRSRRDRKVIIVPVVLAGIWVLMDIVLATRLALWKSKIRASLVEQVRTLYSTSPVDHMLASANVFVITSLP